MIERLEKVLVKYDELNEQLMSEEVIRDIKKSMALAKEKSSLEELVVAYSKYKSVLKQIEDTKSLINDRDLGIWPAKSSQCLKRKKPKPRLS